MKQKARILIVEDERVVSEDIQRSLENLGYAVAAIASSGEEALRHTETYRPDLVMMDIVIRGELNGIETAESIRSRFDIPVVYLTAYADENTLEKAKVTEPYGYILKPYDDRELQSTIEMALYKHMMERKLRESGVWFSTTLRSIGDGVIATDRNGRIMFMNRVAEKLTGWQQEDAANAPLEKVFQLFDGVTREPVTNRVGEIFMGGATSGLSREAILAAKDGRKIQIHESAAPIQDERGGIVGIVLIFKDISERKRADEALRESEERLKTVLDFIPAGIVIMDAESHVIVDANPAAVQMIGKPKKDLIASVCHGFICSAEYGQCPVTDLGQDMQNTECYLRRADSKKVPILKTVVTVTLDGRLHLLESIIDISDRKQAEEALQVSEERYRGLFEMMAQGVLYYDSQSRIIAGNPAAERILNRKMSQMMGQAPLYPRMETVREDGSPFPKEEHPVVVALHTGKPVFNVVLGIVTPKGDRKWLLVSATPVFHTSRTKPDSVFTTFTDITQRKEIEFALQRRNVQLDSMNVIARDISSTLDVKAVMDTALKEVIRLTEFFSGAMFLFNEERSDPEFCVHRNVSARVLDVLSRLHSEKSSYRQSLLRGRIKKFAVDALLENRAVEGVPKKDGQSMVQCVMVPIKEGNRVVGSLNLFGTEAYAPAEMDFDFLSSIGSHIGLAVRNARLYEETNQALERLRIAQDKLVQSEKLASLGSLASNVVHEIGNPLAAITNCVQVLQNRVHLEGQMKELLDIIGWESERLNRSVGLLREFSRPRRLEFKMSDMQEVVKKAKFVLSQDFELMSGRDVVTKFAKSLPLANVDPDAIEQMALNLIKNALQAVDEGGLVEVCLQCRGRESNRRILIRVKDNGPGIPEEDLGRIFEPYFSTKARGMGLGMHIVKQIIEFHGGSIRVKSAVNQGTNVLVEIPVERKDDGEHSGR